MSDSKLDQIVKGAPPPNISPIQVATAAKSSDHTRTHSVTAPHLSKDDPRDNLPSSPPQIYLNLLILESSLRLQYVSLRARLRLHLLLLFLLSAWVAVFTWLLFFRPREDGSGVGGSVYWVIETTEKLGWCGGVVTLCLFYGTGMYERGVRWPRKFVGTTNRGLRGFNMKVVVVKGSLLSEVKGWLGMLDPMGAFREQRVNFQVLPKDIEAAAPVAQAGGGKEKGGARELWNHHASRHGLIEEDIAPSGDVLKLLLLPKPFSPDFREGWETYRMEYWDKENARRYVLCRLVKARQKEVAKREGGWLYWAGWRGWKNVRLFPGQSRRQLDLEKLGLREQPSAEALRAKQREQRRRLEKEGLLRSDSHSRSSSRSTTPTPEPDSGTRHHSRRGSSAGGSTRRPKRSTHAQGSRLSSTESVLGDDGTPKRLSTISRHSSQGSEPGRRTPEPKSDPLLTGSIEQEPAEA